MSDINSKWDHYDYLRCVPAIIFACIIFYISSLSAPFPQRPPEPSILELKVSWNDILHICEFALFAFLIAFGFIGKIKSRYLILFAIIYAFLDEVHQYFVPNRYFDLYDFILDSIGVLLGFLMYLSLVKILDRLNEKYNEGQSNKLEQN